MNIRILLLFCILCLAAPAQARDLAKLAAQSEILTAGQATAEDDSETQAAPSAATSSPAPASTYAPPFSAPTSASLAAPPAPGLSAPPPFGHELFRGQFSKELYDGLNPGYVIMPGDRVLVQAWGAFNQEGVQVVDAQGNIFLPHVGPVRVAGVAMKDLNSTVKAAVSRVFTSNVEVYSNLQQTQPVAVYVTGAVQNPGRYAGGPTDSVLYFLDKAGGVDPSRGSFRNVRVLRGERVLAQIDLYDFLLQGRLNVPRMEDGDVVLVGPRGSMVGVSGDVSRSASYEWRPDSLAPMSGKELMGLARPLPTVSHAAVSGTRQGEPFQTYLRLRDFAAFALADGDAVTYLSDVLNPTIAILVRGAQHGPSLLPVKRTAKLREVLAYIPVDAETVNLAGVHILRKSVAEQQKKALHDALDRLEQSVLTPSAATVEEAGIRVKEAELVAKFVERAKKVEPDGLVVVSNQNEIRNLALEEGDVIMLPTKTDVVLISGEVQMPASVVWVKGLAAADYVRQAGGFTERASKNLVIIRPNGQVDLDAKGDIGPGDRILAIPKVDVKSLQMAKDIMQILYQIAIATKVALDL